MHTFTLYVNINVFNILLLPTGFMFLQLTPLGRWRGVLPDTCPEAKFPGVKSL